MKETRDFILEENLKINDDYSLLRLAAQGSEILPVVYPGQFVQVATGAPGVFLRRPISVHDVCGAGVLILLVRRAGRGTDHLLNLPKGAAVNLLLPLGNGFTLDAPEGERLLLVGGGVGVAPLLYLGKCLRRRGLKPEFLLAAKTKSDLLRLREFERVGTVYTTTDDGSAGVKGLVTAHPILSEGDYKRIYCCGPSPMMKAVANIARERGIECEVSLENMMACGLGACLCCIEKTVKGNVCVCTEGPVFNINQLTW